MNLIPILKHAVSISFFVFVMMLLVEYINVVTRGSWERYFCHQKGWMPYLWAGLLGVLPGCLGAFAAVTLYQHRMFSLGAIVATMIATSGDEAFVMFALVPGQAFLLSAILFGIALIAGRVTDSLFHSGLDSELPQPCDKMVLHSEEGMPLFPGWANIKAGLGQMNRVLLILGLLIFIILLMAGKLGAPTWDWKRVSFLLLGLLSLWIILSGSGHFIREHLWRHVTRVHLPTLFVWIFGALLLIDYLTNHLNLSARIEESRIQMTLFAALLGIIPSSGPHLIFVNLFAQGLIPLGTLLVSSIVQDGHGMLPLLAFSRLDFLKVKGINLFVGLLTGFLCFVLGAYLL